jgi:hypothetical protein
VAKAERNGAVMLSRTSATIKNSDKALKTASLEIAENPCRKNGGGVRSSVPSDMW